MDFETASPGLAFIMRKMGADRWDEDSDGFTISAKFIGRRRRRYFVPRKNVEQADRDLQANNQLPDWVGRDINRISDTEPSPR